MRTYCKRADPTNAPYIEPAIWMAFKGKWKRYDYGLILAEYGDMSMEEVRKHAAAQEMKAFAPAIRKITQDAAKRIKNRELSLEPVRYEMRIDGCSGKDREIGIESTWQQVLEHVAVYCLRDLFTAKIEPCQYASIPGRGPEKGANRISKWVQDDNKQVAYCRERGYRFSRNTEYYVQGDIRKCFSNITRETVMRLLGRDVGKNKPLLWLLDALLRMHVRNLIIGSPLSHFICNYMLSHAVREVYGYQKERRGKSIRLAAHQIWYMDDFLLTGPDRRNLRMAFRRLEDFLKREYGLELKAAHVRRWSDAPPDIMGYVIHMDGTITIRPRNYIKSRRAFTRADGQETLSIPQARRIVAMKGCFVNSGCSVIRKRLRVDEISKKAQRLISDFETGRLTQCIPKSSSTAACPPQSP